MNKNIRNQSCCLICYKTYEKFISTSLPLPSSSSPFLFNDGGNDDRKGKARETEAEVLCRSLQMLQRYLLEKTNKSRTRKSQKSLSKSIKSLEELISNDMGTCQDCFKIMKDFRDLFHQMKTIELLLHWKLWTLKNIMAAAAKISYRVKEFQEVVKSLDLQKTDDKPLEVEKFLTMRKKLVKRCSIALVGSYPSRLHLRKHDTQNETRIARIESPSVSSSAKIISAIQSHPSPISRIEEPLPKCVTKPQARLSNKIPYSPSQPKSIKLRQNTRTKKYISKKVQNSRNFLRKKYRSQNLNPVKARKLKIAKKEPTCLISPLSLSNCSMEMQDGDNDNHKEDLIKAEQDTIIKNEIATESIHQIPGSPINAEDNVVLEEGVGVVESISQESSEAETPIVRKLRAVHKCTVCSRTFSSIKNLTIHKDEDRCEAQNEDVEENEGERALGKQNKIKSEENHFIDPGSSSDNDSESDSLTLNSNSSASDNEEGDHTVSQPVKKEADNNLFKCVPCNRYFKVKKTFQSHRSAFHKSECNKCFIPFKNRLQLKSHMSSVHNRPKKKIKKLVEYKTVSCTQCQLTFEGWKKFKAHTRASHRKILHRFLCPDCENECFTHLHDLFLHRKRSCRRSRSNTEENDDNASGSDEIVTVKLISHQISTSRAALRAQFCSLTDLNSYEEFAVVKVSSKIFVCSVANCTRSFYSKEQLENHSKLHGGSFKCSLCEIVIDYAPDLAVHEHSHFVKAERKEKGRKVLLCPRPNCELNFETKSSYIRHFLTVHLSLPNPNIIDNCCAICKTVSFKTHAELAYHFKRYHDLNILNKDASEASTSTSVKITKCLVGNCFTFFAGQDAELVVHFRRVHSDMDLKQLRRYHCKDCGKEFSQKCRLFCHRLKLHVSKDKVIPCRIQKCSRIFETEEQMANHVKLQHRKAIAYCSKCNKGFMNIRNLKIHEQRQHDKRLQQGVPAAPPPQIPEKKHVCEQCGKRFKEQFILEMHFLSHSGPESWKFQCDICSKKCLSKQKLEEHMRVHSKEKPFVCQVCGVKYAHRHNLRIHVNSKHGDVIEDIPRKFDKTSLTSRKGIKRKRKDTEGEDSYSEDNE